MKRQRGRARAREVIRHLVNLIIELITHSSLPLSLSVSNAHYQVIFSRGIFFSFVELCVIQVVFESYF